ncbi:MAG: M15 family metallopeptidase [Flavobacteriales bacterium]|nr:M15 family metallopeptidase [Flavobacteriales bacterium]
MVKSSWSGAWLLAFVLLSGTGCVADERKHDEPSVEQGSPAMEDAPSFAHSTLVDTTGMETDLRIIERKLGRLSPGIREQLVAVEVGYFSFTDSSCTAVDTRTEHTGVLIVHACVAEDVRLLFETLKRDTFPIAKVVPINRYGLSADSTGWNDAASMADNNTSAFNYRTKPTSGEHSKHAQGIAIDINPMLNPMVRHDTTGTTIEPAGATYDPTRPGTLTRANTAKYLGPYGWSWGGRWPRPQDNQHIEKSRGSCTHMRFSLK